MKITSTDTSIPTAPAADGTLKGTKNEFLKLFMAQLQHQDPLDPKSGADMVAQLAQLTAVEQAQQTNTQLAELAASQASNASASMSNLVGRTCDAEIGAFAIDAGGAPPPVEITASGPMKDASVVITDAHGKEIRRIPIPSGSTATIAWDGKDASGAPVAPGNYKLEIDAGTTTASVTARWHGRIDAVELTADGPRLRMGGVLLNPADIRTIGASASTSTSTLSLPPIITSSSTTSHPGVTP